MSQAPRVNIHIYPTTMENESRILKITKSISDADIFDGIQIIGIWRPGLPESEPLDKKRLVLRLRAPASGGGLLGKIGRTLAWSRAIFRALAAEKIACINCHSLAVLPLSVLLKLRHKAVLVYDAHELETETVGSKGIRRILSRWTERLLLFFVDHTYVVGEEIARWYRQQYDVRNLSVVHNMPYYREAMPANRGSLRQRYAIADNARIFLYQGILGPGRGIEILLDVFSRMDKQRNWHLILMGFGPNTAMVTEFVQSFPNIHYHPAVPPDKLHQYTADADVGLCLFENVCLSGYYALPNKLYEYIACGLAVIASDFPEMGRYVRENGCGWTVAPSFDQVSRLLEEIAAEDIEAKKKGSSEARRRIGWQLEEEALLHFYRQKCYAARGDSGDGVPEI